MTPTLFRHLKRFRVFRNHYLCDACPNEWSDEMLIVAPSYCPSCEAEAEPYDSEALLEETDEPLPEGDE